MSTATDDLVTTQATHLYLQEHPSMKFPSTLPSLIGPVTLSQGPKANRELDKDRLLGSFAGYERVIRVRDDMPEGLQQSVLGHEIFHLVLEDSGLTHHLDPKMEESLCDAFGTWFASALQSGKVVIR